MDDTPLQVALRELQRTFASPRALIAMAAIVLVLGLSGPFDTFTNLSLAPRLIYWLAIVVLTYGFGRMVAAMAGALLRPLLPNPAVRLVVEGLVCGVPVTAIVLGVNAVAFGDTGLHPLVLWGYCTLISVAVLLVVGLIVRAPQEGAGKPAPDAPMPPAILARVPHPQRGRLLALSVEDHYVEVLTDKGRALLLMRLGDAIRETTPVAGVQIHRSHWVALDAVKRVVRREGRVAVELADGRRLPVSRGYLPAARAAGLVTSHSAGPTFDVGS